jgi:4,5-dihydroxyphthalate decarboxylase
MSLRLTAGFSNNLRVRPLMDGTVKPSSIDLDFVISPAKELFYRNLKFEEFDVMEMSIACALMAMERSDGVRWNWKALPIFLSKSFLFINLYANSDSGIENLADLKGKRVGAPDYPMDAVLWLCILLKELYGIEAKDIAWYNGRAKRFSHGAILGLDREPPAITRFNWIPENDTLDRMLDRSDLDAALLLPSSFERKGDSEAIDRYGGVRVAGNPKLRSLFPDRGRTVVSEYFRRTGVIPPNHIIVVKEKLLREHPWVALELYKAFQRSKAVAYERARELRSTYLLFGGSDLEQQISMFGEDPYPLGVRANRKMMETAVQGCLAQGLIKKRFDAEEVFHSGTLDT